MTPPVTASSFLRPIFVHPYPVPAPHAALVRIFHLAVALAELAELEEVVQAGPGGGEARVVEIWTGPLGRSAAECFRWAGVEPHPGVRLRSVFDAAEVAARGGAGRRARAAALDAALKSALAVFAASRPPRPALVLRGEAGAELLVGRLARRASGQEILIHELHRPARAPWRPWPRLRLRRTERQAVEGADALLLVSEALGDDLARRFRLPGAVLVSPSGAPPPVAAPPADGGRDLDLLYVGKLEARKGVDLLLRAVAELPGHRLLLAGGGPRQEAACRRRARRLGVADRVEFTGFLPPREIPALLARARVGVCPLPAGRDPVSDRYTSPMKLLEMMAAGLPVVATAVPPVTRLVRPRTDALVVPPNDPEALARALLELSRDRALAHRLAASALERAAEHDWRHRARALDRFLATLA